jgi:SAM-dependent methyltransferase
VTAERVLTVDQARAFYDRMGAWQDWQRFYEDPPLQRLLQAAKFQAAHSIIEFGCGTGRFALQILSEITPADCRYLGVDLSSTMAALARARLCSYSDRAEVRLSDGNVTVGEPDGRFDSYVSNYYSAANLPGNCCPKRIVFSNPADCYAWSVSPMGVQRFRWRSPAFGAAFTPPGRSWLADADR